MKSLKTLVVLAIMVLGSALSAHAEFKIGPRIGLAVSSLKIYNYDNLKSSKCGFTVGAMCEYTVSGIGVGFDASVMYVHKENEFYDTNTGNVYSKSNYIDIPLNIKWKINIPAVNSIIRPYITTGPAFSFNCDKNSWNEFISSRRTDISWNVGFGVELIQHLQIGASYGWDLTRTFTSHNSEVYGKNRCWIVSAAWMF